AGVPQGSIITNVTLKVTHRESGQNGGKVTPSLALVINGQTKTVSGLNNQSSLSEQAIDITNQFGPTFAWKDVNSVTAAKYSATSTLAPSTTDCHGNPNNPNNCTTVP